MFKSNSAELSESSPALTLCYPFLKLNTALKEALDDLDLARDFFLGFDSPDWPNGFSASEAPSLAA